MTLQVNEPSAKYLVRPQSNNEGAGIPPCGWQIKPLGELSEFITSGSRGWASYYKEHGATFIRSQNVLGGQLDFNDHQCVVPPVGSEGSRTRVEFGDLLITITGNSVGNVAYVDRHLGEAYISQHVGLVRLKDAESAAYICRFLSPGAPGNAQIVSNQSGQSKPGLNLKNLRDFVVSIPPKEEQLAIAAALSDVDALIAGLEKLIAKKRDLKQAAMQQLLTGQTRLPGFSGEWAHKQLGDVICEISDGGTPSTSDSRNFGGDVPWVVIDDIQQKIDMTRSTLTEKGLQACAARLWPQGALIVSTGATIGEVGILQVSAATKQGICGIIFDPRLARPEYMQYWFVNNKKLLLSKAQGSSIKEIRAPTLVTLPVSIPEIDEQAAITGILGDMDVDISIYESRLVKTRELKQGMMQELLTGRTRLV